MAAAACAACAPKEPPVSLIFDTDMAPDYDDVGALAVLHALADSGEARILATVSSKQARDDRTLHRCDQYLFRPGENSVGGAQGRGRQSGYVAQGPAVDLRVAGPVSASHGSASQAEDAVAVYRRALAGEPDTSVVVVTVGFFTNLRDLLLSGPDSLSELTGRELVERKVKRLVSMAGHFPEGLEFNVMMDAPAAAYVMEHWPSPVILSGFEIGEKIITGRRTAAEGPADSPVAEAYRMSLPQDNPAGRNSWDQSAVLVAVRGPEPGFGLERGTLTVDPSDSTDRWTPDPSGRHARLTFRRPPEQIAEQIESLMMHRPRAASSSPAESASGRFRKTEAPGTRGLSGRLPRTGPSRSPGPRAGHISVSGAAA